MALQVAERYWSFYHSQATCRQEKSMLQVVVALSASTFYNKCLQLATSLFVSWHGLIEKNWLIGCFVIPSNKVYTQQLYVNTPNTTNDNKY